jgi:hypothetical protein
MPIRDDPPGPVGAYAVSSFAGGQHIVEHVIAIIAIPFERPFKRGGVKSDDGEVAPGSAAL